MDERADLAEVKVGLPLFVDQSEDGDHVSASWRPLNLARLKANRSHSLDCFGTVRVDVSTVVRE